MKKFLILSLLCIAALDASARQPQRGYHGFVDIGSTGFTDRRQIQTGENQFKRETSYIGYIGLSTSHGYQINQNAYAGIGFDLTSSSKGSISALFADGRYDMKFGKFTPFADLRIGYNFEQGGGIYLSPSIGYRFNWGRRVGINVGAGLILISHSDPVWQYEEHWFPDPENPGEEFLGYWGYSIVGHVRRSRLHFSFRIGLDF